LAVVVVLLDFPYEAIKHLSYFDDVAEYRLGVVRCPAKGVSPLPHPEMAVVLHGHKMTMLPSSNSSFFAGVMRPPAHDPILATLR
jgi:hypothetical protein